MDNNIELTAEFSRKQVEEALKAHFNLPKDSIISFTSKFISYNDCRDPGGGYQEHGHAKVRFKKKLKDALEI